MVFRVSPAATLLRRIVLGLLSCLVLAGCERPDPRGANIVFVGIDTLRADHLGAYGYPRPTSPRFDEFARDAIRFETAVSQSSWTTPAFASIFTGLVPSAHGAGAGRCPDVTALDARHETLAGALRAAGYRTASFVSNAWVGTEVGLSRGFDEHERFVLALEAAQRAITWLGAKPSTPFFLFVHLIDPHQPWAPWPEDAAHFVDPAYAGPLQKNYFAGGADPNWNEADRQHVVDLYDAEIRGTDRLLGNILDALAANSLDSRTIVVVASDHGEELLDHQGLGHGHTLYDELLRVPLVIRMPGGGVVATVSQPVRTMDLFPTLLDAVGLPVPAGLDGVSLVPLLHDASAPAPPGPPPRTNVALAEWACFADDVNLQALRTPSEKLVYSPAYSRSALFDLRDDPREQHDLAATRPEAADLLLARMREATAPAAAGFHLIARGGEKDSLLRVRLVAPSGFHGVTLTQSERDDRFRLSHGGTVLDVKLRLRPHTMPARAWDLDGVSFHTGSEGPVVVRRVDVDGHPLPRSLILIGDGLPSNVRALPVTIGVGTRGIVTNGWKPPPARLDKSPQVQLSFVKPPERTKTVVTPEMKERLRALGYAE